MAAIRTFIAVDVSEEVRERVGEIVERLRTRQVKVSWPKPENLHLTLKFLGDVDESRIAAVQEAVARAATAHAPFVVELQGVGAFPSIRRPRTIWIGVAQGQEPLAALAADVDRHLARKGFPREKRPFVAHLTIGRVRGGRGQTELVQRLEQHEHLEVGGFRAGELRVMASELKSTGAEYRVLHRVPLSAQRD